MVYLLVTALALATAANAAVTSFSAHRRTKREALRKEKVVLVRGNHNYHLYLKPVPFCFSRSNPQGERTSRFGLPTLGGVARTDILGTGIRGAPVMRRRTETAKDGSGFSIQ